jgi:aldehyde:ferredoxin oxidoreductase
MNQIHGWNEKLLRVNLSEGNVKEELIPEGKLKLYLGGRGLGVKYFTEEVDSKIDPFEPGNKLIFATGPLTGTQVPTSGRFSAVSKSPLTGTIFDCNSGGSFGPIMKSCGYDAVILEGKADSPTYLHITLGGAEIQDAVGLWGKSTKQTTDILMEKHGKDSRVCCIGQAGENLVLFANIINDYHHALGRGGLGAVMGSKNLKAVVVNPDRNERIPTSVAEPELLKLVIQEIKKRLNSSPVTGKGLPIFGTVQLVNLINELGLFPINNFQEGFDLRADNLSGEKIRETIFQRKTACYACPIACGRMTKTSKREGKGPEYESDWALGADCGVFDLETVTEANYECNELGLDTISCGATIACAMELNESGKMPKEWADFKFGNKEILVGLIEKIALKKEVGKDLAMGSRRLAEKYRMPEAAMQVKGLEMPAYDPRGAFGMALAYATSNRGACHLRAYTIGAELLGVPKLFDRFSFSDKPDLVIKLQNFGAFYDSIVACKFSGLGAPEDYYSRAVSAVTGLDISVTGAEIIGERIHNLERVYNTRIGFSRKEDTLPPRFSTPLKSGGSKGKTPPLDLMLDLYYDIRGWNSNGEPKKEALKRLGIEQ